MANKTNKKTKAPKKVQAETVETTEVVETANNENNVETEVTTTKAPRPEFYCSKCAKEGEFDEDGKPQFYYLQNGKISGICRVCSTEQANSWTTRRADLRKAQATARRLINQGIAAVIPQAATWKEGDPILTVDGENALDAWEAEKARRKELADEFRNKIQAIKDEAKEANRQAREQARQQREAIRAQEMEAKRIQRETEKSERAAKKAEENRQKAEEARQRQEERLAKALADAQAKAEAVRAEQAKKEAELKAKYGLV